MVETAGQLTHYFHSGLDYSFIWKFPEESVYGILIIYSIVVIHRINKPLESYQSLAGLSVSGSPDGVSISK